MSNRRNKRVPLQVSLVDVSQGAYEAERRTAIAILGEGRDSARLRDLAVNAAQYYEKTSNAVAGGYDGPPLACKKGCSWCCSLEVKVSPPELFWIADYLRTSMTTDAMVALRQRIAEIVGPVAKLSSYDRSVSGIPCPLLVDNACSVYEARPLACRGWNSTNESVCEEATKRRGVMVQADMTQRMVAYGTAAGMEEAAREAGLKSRKYELVAALHIVLEDPSAEERWLSGEDVFRGVASQVSLPPAVKF